MKHRIRVNLNYALKPHVSFHERLNDQIAQKKTLDSMSKQHEDDEPNSIDWGISWDES